MLYLNMGKDIDLNLLSNNHLDIKAFQNRFKTEEDCLQFIYQSKWPGGFTCPRCANKQAYVIRSRRIPLYECRNCRHQASLITDTVMEGSRTSLRKWFLAFYLVSRINQGTNAVKLSSFLQITYKTAWSMLRKIRHAISHIDNNQPLTGIVKGGTTFYSPFSNSSSTLDLYLEQKPVFAAVSLNRNDVPLQVKIKTITPAYISNNSFLPSVRLHFIEEHVSSDNEDINIETKRFRFPRIASLRKYIRDARTWINQTFNGIGSKYLQLYLDEFCFRLNLQLRNVPIFQHLIHVCTRTSITKLLA
ncbi:transposase [Paenibacillus sp. J2TS4]|uniref:transposase n=1 Tax=Paenibacillus sp. J2TS4 TaxID=2807194 RepID=UPI001BD11933|nr:transposase [Paenibacillus sp. J2TS4]